MKTPTTLSRQGFTLVEILAAVTIIGILVFLAIPSLTSVRRDAEESIAIARAECLNMGISSYIQARGLSNAAVDWSAVSGADDAAKDGARYELIKPYLSYPPATLTQMVPSGYSIDLPNDLNSLSKVAVFRPNPSNPANRGTQIEY